VKLAERRVPFGAIYAILNRLERKGFLESQVGGATKERGGRRKKFYSVTDAGMGALEGSRQIRDAMWREIDAVKLEGSPA
jgi:DNA-binding PadR family transcriptional regulator